MRGGRGKESFYLFHGFCSHHRTETGSTSSHIKLFTSVISLNGTINSSNVRQLYREWNCTNQPEVHLKNEAPKAVTEGSEQCSSLTFLKFLTTIQKSINSIHDINLQEVSYTAEQLHCCSATLMTPVPLPAVLPFFW